MTLPYARQPEYLSPSSLREFEKDPLLFYLKRCAPKEYRPPREPQGFAAAVGSAFDAVVKSAIAGCIGLECPPLDTLLKESVTLRPMDEWERAVKLAHVLFRGYEHCGAWDMLMKENPIEVWHDRQIVTIPGTASGVDKGVPLLGYRDCVTRPTPNRTRILDWKVTGANRPGKASPNKGYKLLLDSAAPARRYARSHPLRDSPMEELNERWAMQLASYSWMWRNRDLRKVRVAIDQIVVGEEGRVRVARFRTTVGAVFQKELRDRYVRAWKAVQECAVVSEPWASLGIEAVRSVA